ncbi:MAG: 50S ribosomal protein L6 [bacterium]
MSRIGKLPIDIPEKVDVKIIDKEIFVKGPKGELRQKLNPKIKVDIEDGVIKVSASIIDEKGSSAFWGLFRSLIFNMVKGVTDGFEKSLEINGVGYKVAQEKNKIILNVGYSHPVEFVLPDNVSAKIEKNVIILNSFDKQLLGQMAANIRKIRKPEPYKGKGIKYSDEVIRRKSGKAAKGGEK